MNEYKMHINKNSNNPTSIKNELLKIIQRKILSYLQIRVDLQIQNMHKKSWLNILFKLKIKY